MWVIAVLQGAIDHMFDLKQHAARKKEKFNLCKFCQKSLNLVIRNAV